MYTQTHSPISQSIFFYVFHLKLGKRKTLLSVLALLSLCLSVAHFSAGLSLTQITGTKSRAGHPDLTLPGS